MTDDIYERTTQGPTPEAHPGAPASDSGSTAGSAQPASDAAGPTASPTGTPPPGAFTDVPGPNAGVPPPGYTSYRGYAGAPVAVPPPGGPVPALAALLGLIPGVGAMYNGQFAKGLAHLAIFAVLVSLADHVNGIFGLFVAGWVFYQAFEAYHTARARRDGLPLPNAFGLNDIGERLGLGKNWPNQSATGTTGPARPSSVPPADTPPAWSQAQTYPPPAAPYTASPYAPPAATGANWAGYVSPDAFAQAPPAPYPYTGQTVPPSGVPPSAGTPSWSSVPFTTTQSAAPSSIASPGVSPALPDRRFPVGAVLLIGLGAIFLLSNVAPAWRLSERWLLPLLLAAAAVWTLVRRLGVSPHSATPPLRGGALVCALRLPSVLFVLAIMFLFQAVGWLTIGQSWPLLLIVLGALLLLERTLGRVPPVPVSSPSASGSVSSSPDLAEGSTR